MSVEGVKNYVEKLLGDYRGLYEDFEIGFSSYIEERSEEDNPSKRPKTGSDSEMDTAPAWDKHVINEMASEGDQSESDFFRRVKKLLSLNSPQGSDYFNEFARCLDLFTSCIIIKPEFLTLVEPLFEVTDPTVFLKPSYQGGKKGTEDYTDLRTYLAKQTQGVLDTLKAIVSSREAPRRKAGWFFNPLTDQNTAAATRHGHSYIQPTRPRTACSHRSPLISQVLNSQWISVPYGSEDFSFREMRKNTYEEALFRVEDERYESDLAISQVQYTHSLLSRALQSALSLPSDEQSSYRLPQSLLSPVRLKPISIVYGLHAPKFEELLAKDPLRTIPVVLARLQSKLDAWTATSKHEKERNWADTAEKNYSKSLDYRCFYFKQNEKRLANCKSFLTEAKSRFDHRFLSHKKAKEYISTKQCDCDYEFLGGSKNKLFYSSFAGMSYGIPHYLPANFKDELLLQCKLVQPEEWKGQWGNGRERGRLPQFRLLMNCQPVLSDAYHILLLSIEKSPQQTKEKAKKWLDLLFTEFIGFSPLSPSLSPSSPATPPCAPPIVIRKDVEFPAFLPFLRSSTLLYAPVSIYIFFRFLHTLYERLLKVKCLLAQKHDSKSDEMQPAVPGGEYTYSEKVEKDYGSFLKTAGSVLTGGMDTSEYEEYCGELFQSDAYVLFTFEKLVKNTVKSLVLVGQEDFAGKCYRIFEDFRNREKSGNEERYFSQFCNLLRPPTPPNPFFRLLWDTKTSVLSITYVENPYEKLSNPVFEQTIDYFRSFLTENSENCPLTKELRPYFRRLDRYFSLNRIGELAFSRSLWFCNHIQMGFSDTSLKLVHIPGGEDVLFRVLPSTIVSYVKSEDCLYAFPDKSSFVEKMTEISERNFEVWHANWLSLGS